MHHGLTAEGCNKLKPHIRQCRHPVKATLLLHLRNDMPQCFHLILLQMQCLQNWLIALNELGRTESDRQLFPLRMVLDQMGHRMDAPVYRAAISAGAIAEIRPGWFLSISRHMDTVFNELINAFVFRRRNRYHRNAQGLFQRIDLDGPAVYPHLIHHIQGQDHGNPQLNELNGQIQISLDIRGIENIDDAVWLLIQQKLPGYDLLTGIG